MVNKWYEDPKNVIELAEFIVESEQIETAKELLDYFKHPEKYSEVWKLYQEEIIGKHPSRGVRISNTNRVLPVIMALTEKP